ncbi:cytochrome p450 monooxygenase [Pyrenophora seminiperda CCB06]|uniref:Cytochrome p450 monooxygenase n=1 Tax=Pyrenophora seminiperda CCB06 TaxID=1302712 RepID=A0A3M7MHF4_9PLEO|nr:cytochrome p450 monooxygenase [Pyrenophora seminiperda CCB06]
MLFALSSSPFSAVGVGVLLGMLVGAYVSYLRSNKSLRQIPAAHPLAHFTALWMHAVRWRGEENATLKAAHDRLGPIVCLGPREISVNCVQGGIRAIYAGGFEKVCARDGYNWYSFFSNYRGVDNMFSTGSNKRHAARKRMLSNIYSKSHVTASDALRAQTSTILYARFLPFLERTFSEPDNKGVLNMYALLSATTMDIVTCYIFGLKAGSNLIDDGQQLAWFLDVYNSRRSFNFWPQEFPGLSAFVEKWFNYRLTPKWVDEANAEIEDWTVNMCDSASAVVMAGAAHVQDRPVVYQQLQQSMAKQSVKGDALNKAIASEVLDHLAAGFDTSGITLAYVIHELSQHPDAQALLQREMLSLSPRLVSSSAPQLPDAKVVDSLPYLHAVLWETLRLHSAIPGPQPRFTPLNGCHLGPDEASYYVPGGVRVSASAGLLHLNEEVFERANEWRPERWLDMDQLGDEKRKDMESRWFWAFGSQDVLLTMCSGGRMCVGSHLAVFMMKYIIAALYSSYSTTIVDDTGMEQMDSYTAPPKSDKLIVKLEKLIQE